MVHGIRLREGPRRVVPQPVGAHEGAPGESMIGPDGTVDRSVGVANTHVVAHAGRIMALVESSFPHVLTPSSPPSAPATSTAASPPR
jgi:carotenoid cleavage dioxygenase